jgi:2-methylcitrate dehydratase PrpD
MSHTQVILDFAAAPHVLPEAARGDALRLLADTLAVGAAGANSKEAQKLLISLLGDGGPNQIRSLSEIKLSLPSAALFNGFAIHCLEWDAVHEPAVVHALSVVTAALLAATQAAGGRFDDEFLEALAVGVDIASGLGLSATGPMRFFRPATAGVIGAALAVARLRGYAREQMADVLGLAYSFAGGTMQAHVEASIALPLQIGRAAQAAVQAVDLVMVDMDGPHDVLEGPFGYSALIEPFPSGRASHGALGALQDMGLAEDAVESIQLFAPPLIHRLVGRPYQPGAPMSYNRLCLAFLAPLLLRDGHIDPRLTHSIPDLARKVMVSVDDNPDGNALAPQRLVVTMKDGTVIERQIDANLGSPAAPMSPAQLTAKYDLCRALAGPCDPLIFDDPLSYATDPQ